MHVENLCMQEGTFNACGLLDISVKEICRVSSGPLSREDGREMQLFMIGTISFMVQMFLPLIFLMM